MIYKIIILGDSCVGKTAIIKQFADNIFNGTYKVTIGADFVTKTIFINDKSINLQIWDTAGQERFMSLGNSFYRGIHCCIIVYDVTNYQSFERVRIWMDEFLISASLDEPEKFPFIIIGNKCDQVNIISLKKLNDLRNSGNIFNFEVSAKLNINIQESFYKVAEIVSKNEHVSAKLDTIQLGSNSINKKNYFCC